MGVFLSVFYSSRCLLSPLSQKGNRYCIHSISIGDNLIQTFLKFWCPFLCASSVEQEQCKHFMKSYIAPLISKFNLGFSIQSRYIGIIIFCV